MTYQRVGGRLDPGTGRGSRVWLAALSGLLLLFAILSEISSAATPTQSEKLAKLIDAAKQEGVIDFGGPSSLTPPGAQALIAGLNKKYNLNLKINYVPATNYPAVAAKVITEIQAGQSPTFDIVYLTEANLVKLYSRGFLDPLDWTGTFDHITKDSVYFDNGGIIIATIFTLPIYNTKIVSPQDVPKKWEDLLDPKWKGKMQVPKYVQPWVFLSQVWGEEKTVNFLKGLRALEPVYSLYPEIQTRLASGEYPIAANQVSPFVDVAKQRGIPVEYADQVSPVVTQFDMMGVPKKARHPNAAKLLAAFSLTPEGQEVWQKFSGRSSLFIPGTPASKFAGGKKLLFRDMKALVERSEEFEKLENKLADVLGIR